MMPLLRGIIGSLIVTVIPAAFAYAWARYEERMARSRKNRTQERLKDALENSILDTLIHGKRREKKA